MIGLLLALLIGQVLLNAALSVILLTAIFRNFHATKKTNQQSRTG